ncbi:uncharacterized protein LOC135823642 [Sycon ciliatum]|uniref:uncharacterized protein LOC135823642 n=1 Tax=Sycon ciliatum TaxID=27933 RepID=UPI0031F713CA
MSSEESPTAPADVDLAVMDNQEIRHLAKSHRLEHSGLSRTQIVKLLRDNGIGSSTNSAGQSDKVRDVVQQALADIAKNVKELAAKVALISALQLEVSSLRGELAALKERNSDLDPVQTSTPEPQPNYTLVRRDRPTHGGGLAAYVRDHLRARIVKADTQVEMLMLEVSGQRSKVLLGGVYRPPGTPVQFWQDLTNALDTVISTLPTSPLVLVGDFNVDHFQALLDPKAAKQPWISLALVGDDHVNSCVVVPCTISDHFALALDLRLTTSCTPTVRRGRNIARIDMGQFAHHLLNSDLENFCFARTEDEMWDMWLEKLVAALNTHAPIRLHRPRAPTRKSFPWKTPALHDLVQRRDVAHRRWKASPADPALRNVFTSARDEAKRMSRHLRAIYFRDLLAASQANARKTWQTINYLSGRNKSSVPPAVSVSQLSDQFSGVVSDPTRPLRLSAPLGPTKKECLEEFAPASVQEIAKLLSNIDVRKAAGSDQVPAAILKHCSPVLAPSLTILINASLASGVVPASLKIADVRPLFNSHIAHFSPQKMP